MSDGMRSTAEKLAAAKKKHKAYLKEKGLKNNATTTKDPLIEHDLPAVLNPTEQDLQTQHFESELQLENPYFGQTEPEQQEDPYEASFPLPQYSTDYDNNHHGSSLPDPLSFFDNLTSSVKLPSFTQPLANFFNGSSGNSQAGDEVELPDQILVGENHQDPIHPSNQVVQNMFSYDKFKNYAIKSVNAADDNQSNTISETILDSQNVFEQFTNSSSTEIETFHNSRTPQLEVAENQLDSAFMVELQSGINEHKPVLFETQPTLEVETSQTDSTALLNHPEIMQNLEETAEITEVIPVFTPSNYHNSNSEELEKQNKELMALLEQQNMKNVQLNTRLEESEMKYSKLYNDFQALITQKEEIEIILNSKLNGEAEKEIQKLREDLQSHLQSINMLVAERTELNSQLDKAQTQLKNESNQVLDLKTQLKEVKQHYNNLENELDSLKSEKLNSFSAQKEHIDMFNKMHEDYIAVQNQCDELRQDLSELKEKLKSSYESNGSLQKQVQELTNHLSMANLKIQQLTLGETSTSQHESEINRLNQEKNALEKQIHVLTESLKSASSDRDESNVQYQQYVAQLNSQISQLATSLQQIQAENQQLKIQEENRVRHIGELEKQLQNAQNDNFSMDLRSNNKSLKKELESSLELIRNLQIEKNDLETNLTKTLIDKELSEKELESCKFSISEMESIIEQLKGNQPDNAVLLATMESDKVAASRAISQNNELKKQMEGLQEVLVKVNNDNVQLTESISYERNINRNLMEKLQKTETAFQTLTGAIEIKDKELVNLREQLEKMNNHLMQQEQLSDRLRHYEAQEHSSSSLQKELLEAKQKIAQLTNDLNTRKENSVPTQQVNVQCVDETQKYSEDDLQAQLNNLQIRNRELETLLKNASESKKVDTNGNESLDKDTAMRHLEKKFLKTMDEIAKLTEEKQRLEHLVLQLQGETETIGEYVTLYQHQRSILKQRALEKDQQLQQLTNDREIIKANLDRLNNLVSKLVIEKGAITKELLDHHKQFSEKRTDLCEQHQKIHQEINRITGDSLKNSKIDDNPNTEIAEEIITLLSEIKSSNLVQPATNDNFHHCPWCSGKLITV